MANDPGRDRASERGRGANGAARPFPTRGAAPRQPDAPVHERPDALSFEAALEELDRIVEALEGERLPLDESLALNERGVHLTRRCQELLDGAELRVERLRAATDGEGAGRPGTNGAARAAFTLEDFEDDEG